jgi:hypothetical protein
MFHILSYLPSRLTQYFSASQDSGIEYRKIVGKFHFQYGLLVINSFGLQNALDNSKVDASHFFARCHTAASQCAIIVRDELVPRGFLKYSPDSHFVLISYAVLTLLKACVRSGFKNSGNTNTDYFYSCQLRSFVRICIIPNGQLAL